MGKYRYASRQSQICRSTAFFGLLPSVPRLTSCLSLPTGSMTQKGVTTYALSPNRQRPLAGALNSAVFNTWRRFRGQALYVIPPFVIAYLAMGWAIER